MTMGLIIKNIAPVLLPICVLLGFTFNLMRVIENDPQRPRDGFHFLPPPTEVETSKDDDVELVFNDIDELPPSSDDQNALPVTVEDANFEFLPDLTDQKLDNNYGDLDSQSAGLSPTNAEFEENTSTNHLEQVSSNNDEDKTRYLPDILIPKKPTDIPDQSLSKVMYLPDYVTVDTRSSFKDFIGSPDSTILELRKRRYDDNDCLCPLLSIDCLHTISCMSRKQTGSGVAVRNFIRRHASFWRKSISDLGGSPIGMSSQYTTISVFREWLSKNQLPIGLKNRDDSFVNTTRYDYCVKNNLKGRKCFVEDFTTFEEEGSDDTDVGSSLVQRKRFIEMKDNLLELQERPLHASPLTYLLAYCHISHITLQLRPFVLDLYQSHLREVSDPDHNESSAIPFKVGLHVRRGDACGHSKTGYEDVASKLDSIPQVSHLRKCYQTNVYLKALRKILKNLKERKEEYQLVVYVATDHSASLLKEIEEADPDLYASTKWMYLEYSRDLFDYLPKDLDPLAYFIESPENPNKGVLGESAILDIHHLSHGIDAFVGHLGSRFGKLGWYQAIAVRNGFVPFFTVDGHSTCCDIDENCGKMAKDGAIVSMENCLGLFYPQIDEFRNNQTETDYWVDGIGATHRKLAAKAERVWRKNREDVEASGIPNIWRTDLNANPATWDYYPKSGSSTKKNSRSDEESTILHEDESNYFTSSKQCQEFIEKDIPTSLPELPLRNKTNGACDGYEGIFHIRFGDVGGASGTVFFQFMVGQLLWAEQHNYKPWVHMNGKSQVIYDDEVHGNPEEGAKFTMLDGMRIGWARHPDEPLGYMFPGVPYKRSDILQRKKFRVKGTGVWNHYFYPVSDFNPNDLNDKSCRNKPLVTMDYDHVLPGLHSHAPWVPHPWRYWMPDYIQKPFTPMKSWLDDQRKRATKVVQKYIHFGPYLKQRALCAHPASASDEPSLGMHIRHGDKFPSRDRIELKKFFPYAKAFLEAYPKGTIYLATDSALVYKEIQETWDNVGARVYVQPAVQGLSSNDTAAFDLGVSKHRTNIEALTDILALSKCKYLLHGWSAMTEAVFFLNPKLMDHAVDLELDYELGMTEESADEAKFAYFEYLLGGVKNNALIKKLKLKKNK